MRRLFLTLIVALAGGSILGLLMQQDSGYVLIAYHGVTIESSLWVLIIVLILFFVALSWLKRLLFATLHPGSSLAKVTSGMSQKRASRNTIRGLMELVGGNWGKAEKLLTSSANKVPYPLINYIGAAYAASEQDSHERSKALLRAAHQTTPEAEFAISFAQSQIQMRQGHFEGALATLLRLHKIQPKHRQVLKMLVQAYTQLKDWDALLSLTPILKKEGILNDEHMRELEKKAFQAMLDNLQFRRKVGRPNAELIKEMEKLWQKLAGLKDDEDMAVMYVRTLIHFGDEVKAEQFIRSWLNQNWSETLIQEYGHLVEIDRKKALQQAENWLKKQPQSAGLLLACGRLCQQQKFWGKARDYYQSAIELEASAEAIGELSRLLNAMGEGQLSQELMLAGLHQASSELKPLPLPHH